MRILHTSDWHLGRLFHGAHLLGDQARVLEQIPRLVKDNGIDTVVIAGDIYDRQVPPPEAVELLDETLARLALDHSVPVLVIAGNHDSPERLGFASRILAGGKVHVAGGLNRDITPVVLRDGHGPVNFFLLPYSEPSFARGVLGDDAVVDHDSAAVAMLRGVRPGPRSVLVAHAFVAGGLASPDSERPLSVGGAGTVEASSLEGFSYVALGHLHRPQVVGDRPMRYSGSLLKYSFDEASHKKTMSIVEMDVAGRCNVEEVALTPRRDVRRVEGTLAEVLQRGAADVSKDDYVEVSLLGRDAIIDPQAQIRKVYPNLLHLLRPDLERAGELLAARVDFEKVTEADLFASFFEQVSGAALTGEERAALYTVLESLRVGEVNA
jgi:exonuclease SbcD